MASDDPAALQSLHQTFVGWRYGDPNVTSLTLDGAWIRTKDGKDETIQKRHEVRRGFARRTTSTSPRGTQTDSGFTGSLFWAANQNGFTVPLLGEAALQRITSYALFNEETTLLTAKATGHKTVRGVDTVVLRITRPNSTAPPMDVYENPQTGAYMRAVVSPGLPLEYTYDILNYTEFSPGKKVIGAYRLVDEPTDTFTYSKVVANAAVSDEELRPPAPRSMWTFANDQPFPIKVTEKRIILTARVNGVEGRFIMDTGDAAGISFTREFAGRAKLKKLAERQSYGIGGVSKDDVNVIDSLEIGGNTLKNVIVTSGLRELDSNAPDGLIGYDFLAGAVVDVDIDNQLMTILDPKLRGPDLTAGIPVRIDLSDQLPIVPMKLNNSIEVFGMLDSGDPVEVLFSSDLIFKNGMKFLVDSGPSSVLNSYRLIGGVGGYEAVRCGKLDSLQLGNVTYRPVPACESKFNGNSNRVLVGFDFLRGFNMTFDYPHAIILFTPRKTK